MAQFTRNKRELNKEKAIQYLGGKKCYRCKADHLHIATYDFHHITGIKEDNISKMLSSTQWPEIQKELNQCVILCANCHREVHALKEKIIK